MRTALALALVMFGATLGCGGGEPAKSPANASTSTATSTSGAGTASGNAGMVKSFTVGPESGKTDKVGGSDGALKPDGNPDLAFTADVEGPIAALFIISVTAKGEPNGEYQADTIVALDQFPADFPIAQRAGMLTAGIGVWEGGKLLSKDDGSLSIPAGAHKLDIYVSSTGVLKQGSKVQIWTMRPDKTTSKGPIADL